MRCAVFLKTKVCSEEGTVNVGDGTMVYPRHESRAKKELRGRLEKAKEWEEQRGQQWKDAVESNDPNLLADMFIEYGPYDLGIVPPPLLTKLSPIMSGLFETKLDQAYDAGRASESFQ